MELIRTEAKNKQEYITCSAIWYHDKEIKAEHQPKNVSEGYVLCGLRHHNCMANAFVFGVRTGISDHTQGFLTSKNRFVDREEGGVIAFEAKQISEPIKMLFSEDLY